MVRLAIVVGFLLLPGLAAGEELELELGASTEYDSNVFRTQTNEEDDWIFRLIPAGTLFKDEGDLRYRLRYAVPFEHGVDTGEQISDFDQIVNFNSSWIYDEANEFFAENNFRYDRSVTRRFAVDANIPDVSNQRRRITTNRATVGWNHAFSPRTSGGVSFGYDIFQTEQANRQDNQTLSAVTSVNYALDTNNQVGTGFSFAFQDFEEAGGIPGSRTFYYNLFGSWVFQFDETTTLSVTGGPTLIQSDQDGAPAAVSSVQTVPTTFFNGQPAAFDFNTCTATINGFRVFSNACRAADPSVLPPPAVNPPATLVFAPGASPGSQSDLNLTGFGNFDLTRRWTPTVETSLAYRRQQSNASGLGGSTILDAVTLRGNWDIDQWWNLGLRGDFTHRESVGSSTQTFLIVQNDGSGRATFVDAAAGPGLTAAPFRNSIETNRWGVGARLARRIGRRAVASLRLNYNEQDSQQNTRGSASDFKDFLAIFGVRYRFEPISLW